MHFGALLALALKYSGHFPGDTIVARLRDVELGLDSRAREREGVSERGLGPGCPVKSSGHLCGTGAGGLWACVGRVCVLPVQIWTFLRLERALWELF